jgi:hypothetical protein
MLTKIIIIDLLLYNEKELNRYIKNNFESFNSSLSKSKKHLKHFKKSILFSSDEFL